MSAPPIYTVTPSPNSVTISLTAPQYFGSIEDGSVQGNYYQYDNPSPFSFNNRNPTFSIQNLLSSKVYIFYVQAMYSGSLPSEPITFNATTCPQSGCTSSGGGGGSGGSGNLSNTSPAWLPYLGILGVIPLILILCCCLIGLLGCIVLCVIVRKRRGKKNFTVESQQGTNKKVVAYELVQTPTTGNDVQDTLVEKFMKQYILDYNKIVFASQVLGTGAQGTVYKGTYLMTDVAVKLVTTQQFGSNTDLTDFYNEAKLLSEHSNHPNIVKFIGIAHNPQTNQIALITEYCQMGNLANAVESTEFTWNQRIKILFGIASGMAHLHLSNIIHRDLKAENVLLDGNCAAKIIDFGFSKEIQDMNKTMNMTMNVGTSSYVAPEVIRTMNNPITPITPKRKSTHANSSSNSNTGTTATTNESMSSFANSSMSPTSESTETNTNTSGSGSSIKKKREYDMMVDVYSFGIIMWVVYYGNKYPYGKNVSDFQIIHSLSTDPNFRPALSDDIPPEEEWYIDLMKRCWATDPTTRPSFETICTILLEHSKHS